MMKKLSNIFLVVAATLVLAWFLPWLVGFAVPSASKSQVVYYSPVSDKFVTSRSDDDDGKMKYFELNADGSLSKEVTRDERDRLLPQVFYTVLSGKDELPDTVCGRQVSIKIFKENSWVFVSSPREVNRVNARVDMMMESMPERLELEDATEVFRFTSDGMEFVDMATNAVLPERSARFTKMLKDEGFAFPATVMNANVTSRKPYDEGYLMADANHRLYHVKMQVGRPYVHCVADAEKIDVRHVFVTENADHRFLGVVTDADHNVYMLEASTYAMRRMPFKWNPEKEKIVIMANVFNWVVNVNDGDKIEYCAVDNNSMSLLGNFSEKIAKSRYEKLEAYVFPFTLSFTSGNDQLVYPRIAFAGSWMMLVFNAVLAVVAFAVCRRCRRKSVVSGIVTLILGIYVFIPILLFTNSK